MSTTDSIIQRASAVLDKVPPSPLVQPLRAAFDLRAQGLAEIEDTFRAFTAARHPVATNRMFFHNWSRTNHSAMCVSGISNRMTGQLHDRMPGIERGRLVDAVVSLNRISDEDLGVGGGRLHADLFQQMAEPYCDGDGWRLDEYALPAARAFTAYRHETGLKDRELMHALLMTTVHELYTHGEVEFILPLFQQNLAAFSSLPHRKQRLTAAWIIVHCGPTEQEHFGHALDAVGHYMAAHGLSLDAFDPVDHFTRYLDHKIAVMRSVHDHLDAGGPTAPLSTSSLGA